MPVATLPTRKVSCPISLLPSNDGQDIRDTGAYRTHRNSTIKGSLRVPRPDKMIDTRAEPFRNVLRLVVLLTAFGDFCPLWSCWRGRRQRPQSAHHIGKNRATSKIITAKPDQVNRRRQGTPTDGPRLSIGRVARGSSAGESRGWPPPTSTPTGCRRATMRGDQQAMVHVKRCAGETQIVRQ
jgi:hypothetical protein